MSHFTETSLDLESRACSPLHRLTRLRHLRDFLPLSRATYLRAPFIDAEPVEDPASGISTAYAIVTSIEQPQQ